VGTVALSTAIFAGWGCGVPSMPERLASYHEQIAEALGEPRPLGKMDVSPIRLPRRRVRGFEVESAQIGVMDFLSIQGCDLSTHIGYRNGALGKQMGPSRRLVYELSVLESSAECLKGIAPERAQRLRAVFDGTREVLPRSVWNAVWEHPEVERFLSFGSPARLAGDHVSDIAALDRARRLVRSGIATERDAVELETALVSLRDEESAGSDFQQMHHLAYHLSGIAKLLSKSSDTTCTPKGRRLAGVFEEVYLPIQTQVATWDQRVRVRIDALGALYAATRYRMPGQAPQAMERHAGKYWDAEAPDGLWREYRDALRVHARAWESTLRACGILPSAQRPVTHAPLPDHLESGSDTSRGSRFLVLAITEWREWTGW
jgi:hypothetical protein